MDGVNGTTKTKLTMATARQLRTAEESEIVDVKKFSAHTVKDGVAVSAALEAKRMLEIDGITGAKSNKKYQKREASRGIKTMYNHVRGLDEELTGSKYRPPNLPKGVGLMELYHIYCCPDLGVGAVALRRIPCCCPACKASLQQAWVHKIPFEKQIDEQPRFQPVIGCKYSEILGDENNWFVVQLEQRKDTDAGYFKYLDDEADNVREEI